MVFFGSGKNNRMSSERTGVVWKRWQQLHWTNTPSRFFPHGISGLLTVVVGLRIVTDSMSGRVYQYEYSNTSNSYSRIPAPVLVFAGVALINSISGYQLSPKATHASQIIFRNCAMLQIGLCYFIVRFLPHFTVLWRYLLEEEFVSRNGTRTSTTMIVLWKQWLWIMDAILTGILLYSNLAFWRNSTAYAWKKSKIIVIAASVGSMAIMLLSVYPVQLVWNGQEWYECVQTRYSHQASGMVGYIYVPATVTFAMILFGATLNQRKIVSDVAYGLSSAVIVCVCVVGTVLSQEVHIPYVSTQRIYSPCIEPIVGSTEYMIVKALDFSMYARSILTAVFGIEYEPYYQ